MSTRELVTVLPPDQNEDVQDSKMIFISSEWSMDPADYQLQGQIGQGMNGNEVWRAIYKGETEVAIKKINLNMYSNLKQRQNLAKEVYSLAISASSEDMVAFYCSFKEQDFLWVVLGLMEASIYDVIKWLYPTGFENEELIANIMFQLVRGIAYLHHMNILHRDIKAANILIDSFGKIKITDFGVSAVLSTLSERRFTMTGTWNWMAPEILDPEVGHNQKADIWSIGITAIEMAFGFPPYWGKNEHEVVFNILSDSPPPSLKDPYIPKAASKSFSKEFNEFVSICLRKKVERRPDASKLLSHKFIKNLSEDLELVYSHCIQDLPSPVDRFQRIMEEKAAEARRVFDNKRKNPLLVRSRNRSAASENPPAEKHNEWGSDDESGDELIDD
eukprot:TRINITY_DN9379_c0_g1_i1.p1 TRINITY_DN9379_c0_g1~~TRINITY_DN9379_c0_g1_i1.p1  ORF type:complete len:388 (+),score=83.34 TRINITY_DN9379_c0_g1_i1:80-1243(+)